MAKGTMDVVKLILRHGEKIPKIQKLLGQKEKLEVRIKTAQKDLKTVDSELDRLISATSTTRRRKKKAKRGRPKGKGRVGRPKGRKKKAGRPARPTEGRLPYLMAQVMSKTQPMKAGEVIAALGKAGEKVNPATVTYNLSNYPYFKNIRGKGFTYAGPAVPGLKKAKKARKKSAKRKATRKKTAKKGGKTAASSPAAAAPEGQSG